MSANDRIILVEEMTKDFNSIYASFVAELNKMEEKSVKLQQEAVELEKSTIHLRGCYARMAQAFADRKTGEQRRLDQELNQQQKEAANAASH